MINWVFSLQKSISKSVFAGYSGSQNSVWNKLKLQFVELDFSKLIFQKSSKDQQEVWQAKHRLKARNLTWTPLSYTLILLGKCWQISNSYHKSVDAIRGRTLIQQLRYLSLRRQKETTSFFSDTLCCKSIRSFACFYCKMPI